MGIGSEIDIYLRKLDAIGLNKDDMKELKRLWEHYQELNKLYGHDVGTFAQLMAKENKGCQ